MNKHQDIFELMESILNDTLQNPMQDMDKGTIIAHPTVIELLKKENECTSVYAMIGWRNTTDCVGLSLWKLKSLNLFLTLHALELPERTVFTYDWEGPFLFVRPREHSFGITPLSNIEALLITSILPKSDCMQRATNKVLKGLIQNDLKKRIVLD